MPVRFGYVQSETPPAPYVTVSAARSADSVAVDGLPAKIDSGADRTVVPASLVERLSLDEMGRSWFEGLGGVRVELVLYRLILTIRGCSPITVVAAGSDGEPRILLGRDVLNRYAVLLDGPNMRLENPLTSLKGLPSHVLADPPPLPRPRGPPVPVRQGHAARYGRRRPPHRPARGGPAEQPRRPRRPRQFRRCAAGVERIRARPASRGEGKEQAPAGEPDRPRASDGVSLWLDTRDGRAGHRASRYCHQFHFLAGRRRAGQGRAGFVQTKINRAAQDAPPAPTRPTCRSAASG